MAIFIIGAGLWSLKDITLEGLELVKKAKQVWFENYTSLTGYSVQELENFIGKKVKIANRSILEENLDLLLAEALKEDVALIVGGEPLFATTHFEIVLEAKKRGIKTRVVHNASVASAISNTGLFLYKFGKISSIPFQSRKETIRSPYEVLSQNKSINAHTLFLLDLDPEKNDFLSVGEAITYLKKAEEEFKGKAFSEKEICIGCARLGSPGEKIVAAPAEKLLNIDFGAPPYALVVPGKELNFKEKDALEEFFL